MICSVFSSPFIWNSNWSVRLQKSVASATKEGKFEQSKQHSTVYTLKKRHTLRSCNSLKEQAPWKYTNTREFECVKINIWSYSRFISCFLHLTTPPIVRVREQKHAWTSQERRERHHHPNQIYIYVQFCVRAASSP